MLVRDEVCYSKQWNLMYGLLEDKPDTPVCVGGIAPDYALLPYDEETGFPHLSADHLASLNVSTVLKPTNSRGPLWQIQQIPRGHKTDKHQEFQDMGTICIKCCEQNNGIPPSVIAFDGHGSFETLNCALLGLVPEDELAIGSIEFWEKCTTNMPMSLPLFACKTLFFGETPVFGSLDPKHCQKVTW